MTRQRERIVVTGIGVICANGVGQQAFWDNVTHARSGIRTIGTVDMTGIKTSVGGELAAFNLSEHFSLREQRSMDRCGQMAVVAAREAITQASIDMDTVDPYRAGIVLGTSLGGMVSGQTFHKQWISAGHSQSPSTFVADLHTPLSSRFGWYRPGTERAA